MLEYLQKFKNLPPEIKSSVSSPQKMVSIAELEKKYGLKLGAFVMRVAVKDIYFNNLAANLIKEFELDPDKALALEKDLNEVVFKDILRYLKRGPVSPILPKQEEKKPGQKVDLSHLLVPKEEKKEQPVTSKKIDLSHLLSEKRSSGDRKEETKKAEDQKMPVKEAPKKEDNTQPAPKKTVLPEKIEDFKTFLPPTNSAKKEIKTGDDLSFEEDKKDIDGFSEKAQTLQKEAPAGPTVDEIIDQIKKEMSLSFASEIMAGRFKQIISTYLRGVRNRVDTRGSLVKEVAKGGMNFEADLADRVLRSAESKNKKPIEEQPEKVNVKSGGDGTAFIFENKVAKPSGTESQPIPTGKMAARDVEYDLASILKKNGNFKQPEAIPAKQKEAPKPEKPKETFKKGAILGEGTEEKGETMTAQNTPTASTSSKRVDDIRAPKVMGPIDELRYMDLTTFRRFAMEPAARVNKVEEKIDILSRQGIEKRLEGISAWRQSPVNKIYLSIGKQSISLGKSVEDIIGSMKKEGKEVLEKEEFEAIMDLNDKLRY